MKGVVKIPGCIPRAPRLHLDSQLFFYPDSKISFSFNQFQKEIPEGQLILIELVSLKNSDIYCFVNFKKK